MSSVEKGVIYRNKISQTLVKVTSVSKTTVTYTSPGMSHPQRLSITAFNNAFQRD